jgi:ABC-2 type transport system ATP-binding protein
MVQTSVRRNRHPLDNATTRNVTLECRHIAPVAEVDTGMSPVNQNQSVISARALRKTWPGGAEAVRGIDFEVAAGEVFGLLGPNGAGKSTTIGMLTTAITPSGGVARIGGFDVAAEPIAARAVSGIVFQDAVVDQALTGRTNLNTHALLWGMDQGDARGRIRELAGPFGLNDLLDRRVNTYSGGERRRLEIARALVPRPRALFLDEPTVGLDPRMRYELIDLVAGLRQSDDLTVLLTTHYLDEAERLCDRIGIMHEGRIVASGSPAELLATIGDEVVELRTGTDRDAARVLEILRARGIAGADALIVGRTVSVPIRRSAGIDLAADIAGLELPTTERTTRVPHLDDVYLRLTGERIAA